MIARVRLFCTLAGLAPASVSGAQLFEQPQVEFVWNCELVARTIAQSDSSVLCERDWPIHVTGHAPFTMSEVLNVANGGCQLVSLVRGASFRVQTPPGEATLAMNMQTQASTVFETVSYGQATGNADSNTTLRVRLREWARANLVLSFAADDDVENVATFLSANFRGPIDPIDDAGVIFSDAWSGDTHTTITRPSTLLPPGVYELTATGQAELLPLPLRFFDSSISASARFTSATPEAPSSDLDLDDDGWVGLSDACAWPNAPTDANADGNIDDADFAFLLAIIRAAGESATDDNHDGMADQCACAADWNADGGLDFFDVQAFLQAFASHLPSADLNNDGLHNFFDLQEFLNRFSAGC